MQFSIPISDSIARKALLEAEVLYTAADCGLSFQALNEKLGPDASDNDFWFHTRGALRGSFVINWCKLFGVNVKNTYWKQTTIEQKAFRDAVYGATGFDYQAWSNYRKEMSDLKAVLSEHLNPYYPIEDLPDFKPAMQVLVVCHDWLRQVAQEFGIELEGPPAKDDYFAKVTQDINQILANS